ncbi:MAG: hypothetical protein WKF82_10595 [Nocardioidaceae bacterium]
MNFDIDRIRGDFSRTRRGRGLLRRTRRLAGAAAGGRRGGRDTGHLGISNRGTVTAAEQRADAVVRGARAAVADLLGCRRRWRGVRPLDDPADLRRRPRAMAKDWGAR